MGRTPKLTTEVKIELLMQLRVYSIEPTDSPPLCKNSPFITQPYDFYPLSGAPFCKKPHFPAAAPAA